MKTVENLVSAYKAGTLKPSEVVSESLALIKEKNKDLNIFLDIYEDALETAKEADELYKNDAVADKPLLGVPVAVKNNILIKGKTATGGSRF